MSKLSIRGRYFRRYLSTKVLPVWSILLIDTLLVAISVFGAFLLRFDWQSIWLYSAMVEKSILAVVVVNLVFFHVFRTYSNVLRFSSFVDIMRIFVSLSVSYAVLMVASADGYKMNLYYTDGNTNALVAWEFDCIDK